MELNDVADLVAADLADTSVLHRPEPLILRPDRPIAERAAADAVADLRRVPTVTVLVGRPDAIPHALLAGFDVCLTDQPDPPAPWVQAPAVAIEEAVGAHPATALALVALLRTSEHLDTWSAIAAEASTYAALQASADHLAWLHQRGPATARPGTAPAVQIERTGAELSITLDRPEARNAVDRALRDALVEALDLARTDPTIERVHLDGNGPDFCAGGDLHEFGTTTDPATSLAVRLTCHPGRAAAHVADRLHAHLHGHCYGAGIEIPAFARHVTAHPDTTIALPELGLGLVPGAGGTVSLPRRIGRQRTAYLALTGRALDAAEAHAWGLVDDVGADPIRDRLRGGVQPARP